MKSRRLLDILGNIDDKYIEEAREYKPSSKSWKKHLTQAALFIFAVMLIPLTTIRGCGSSGMDGMGSEKDNYDGQLSSIYYDILPSAGGIRCVRVADGKNPVGDDLKDKARITELPVYKNLAYVSAAGGSSYFSEEELTEIAGETADILGVDVGDVSVETDNDGAKVLSVSAHNKYFEITVYGNRDIDVMFEHPDDSYTDGGSIYDKTAYYCEKYSELLGYDEYKINIDVSYTYTGEEYTLCRAYKADDEPSVELIGEYFNSARFLYDENGALYGIYMENVLSSGENMATLPLVGYEEAKEMLTRGEYVSDFYEGDLCGESLTEDDIICYDIVYSDGEICRYFIPYYAFYLRTEESCAYGRDDIVCCGVYYVPAINSEDLMSVIR
ncbi:MAG: hypothetical protein E7218_03025 [Anaerofustis stercorihominis]|nr:hypothetical protein [Anaerofustis stercorihominis]